MHQNLKYKCIPSTSYVVYKIIDIYSYNCSSALNLLHHSIIDTVIGDTNIIIVVASSEEGLWLTLGG